MAVINTRLLLLLSLFFCGASSAASGPENHHQVSFGTSKVSLLGTYPALNQPAPLFRVIDGKFNPIDLSDFKGQTILISSVPSLDTGVCAIQTKKFNDQVANFSDNVIMLSISTDLPFAQKRFCQQQNVDKIMVLSDAVWREFGTKYGLLMKDKGLLARAILIINKQGDIQYRQLVSDTSKEPDYKAALAALTKISSEDF
ncbi:thiol peroxidase [Shewanella sp. 202IG2-18]|uniref:thiol peroxidase n=1 Tax=Parashewanella hymeniacidonis TaxID=2807618 RepID=UPI0019619679|nr:thiol peroxidase [Parashewanella hymeniacidonis]MBM7072133.1 thiol peroxidase [Parashewanella hymeniacidonis]